MATALAREAAVPVAEIIHDLESAYDLPEEALRLAVPHAAEIAPAVIELAEKATRGVQLMPKQENLFFWGIHVLAAGRRTELYRPLMRLLAQQDEAYLDSILGEAVTETLASIVISIFDGDPDPLIDACAKPSVEGALRWNLMTALARLTFDGSLPRERTLAFLDRFDRESLAEPGDIAWIGWAEAIQLLGLEEMRERVHATWNDGRNPERKPDRRVWDERLTTACSLALGDAGLFVRDQIVALDDPVARLGWMAAQEAKSRNVPDTPDAGAIFALTPTEMRWLKRFSVSRHVRGLYMEMIDGFFCGHLVGPGAAQFNDVMPVIWADGVAYDSVEQAEYVRALLARHWQTISARLAAEHPHAPVLQKVPSLPEAAGWAAGFLYAINMKVEAWTTGRGAKDSEILIMSLMALTGRKGVLSGKLTEEQRATFVLALPLALRSVHASWHGQNLSPLGQKRVPPDLKIGRNEPCPCGSGKKYKRCCGSSQ